MLAPNRLTTPEMRDPTLTSAPTIGLMMPVARTDEPISRLSTRTLPVTDVFLLSPRNTVVATKAAVTITTKMPRIMNHRFFTSIAPAHCSRLERADCRQSTCELCHGLKRHRLQHRCIAG